MIEELSDLRGLEVTIAFSTDPTARWGPYTVANVISDQGMTYLVLQGNHQYLVNVEDVAIIALSS